VTGARWVQKDVLDAHKDAQLRVYAVWFDMVEGDARDRWPPELLTDRRVVHFWDEERTVGRFFARRTQSEEMENALTPNSNGLGQAVLWDSYLVFGPESRWEDEPGGIRRWGRTINRTRQGLLDAVNALLAAPGGTK
jgi:hypothetical protein